MATLFNLPKAVPVDASGQPYPGAKLYFYAAGTTTAQAVYSNVGLTTAHANPVVADAYGRFAAIYLNPDATADYRIQLKTAAGVLIYDVDNIPRGASSGGGGVSGSYSITAKETAAGLVEADLDLTYPTGDLRRYQAVGNGTADDSEVIEYAFASNYNGAVYFTPGLTYKTTRNIVVTQNTQVFASGATFSISHTGTGYTLNSDVSWHGGTFNGPGSAYSASSKCLVASGTRNGAGIAPTYAENISIYDVSINLFGSTAIDISFARDVTIVRPRITSVGYIGVIGYSCLRMRVIEPYIDTLVGESGSGELNAYGVTFTSLTGVGVNVTRDPVSSDCEVKGGYISNIPTWHALDTHGGSFIKFSGVTIYNCRRGVIITNTGTTGAQNCIVENCYYDNELSGTNSNGEEKISEALWDIGVSDSARNTANVFRNNTIINGGKELGVGGAMFVQYASDGVVSDNTFRNCRNHGIYVAGYARRYTVSNNEFIDVHGPGIAGGGPSNDIHGIYFAGNYFENFSVVDNKFIVTNTAIDTYVLTIGVLIGNFANKSLYIDRNIFKGTTYEVYNLNPGTGLSTEARWDNISGGWSGYFSAASKELFTFGLVTDINVACHYSKTGDLVTLRIGDWQGTAHGTSTTFVVTYLPEFLRPATNQTCLCKVVDGPYGQHLGNVVIRATDGGMEFYPIYAAAVDVLKNATGLFQTSGTKGTSICTISYTTRAAT